jgi:hypothetical protein
MEGLSTAGADRKTVMIDATYLKAHRTASSLTVKRMARPVGKWLVSDVLSSLRKRIRPFRRWVVGQDGNPRVLVLFKGPASSAI